MVIGVTAKCNLNSSLFLFPIFVLLEKKPSPIVLYSNSPSPNNWPIFYLCAKK